MQTIQHIVIHYDEIGLKAANRRQFEELLIRNAARKTSAGVRELRRESGQLTAYLRDGADVEECIDALRRVPGIAHLSPALRTEPTIEAMSAAALSMIEGASCETFAIDSRRHDKTMSFDSMDVNRQLGTDVLEVYPDWNVNLSRPDLTVKVEMNSKNAYISVRDIPGVGGLPTDSRQRVVVLLSGGLDSPLAAYMMMKRGCEAVLVHFQNENQMTDSVEDKIVRLAEQLSRYQVKTRLLIVPFGEIQAEILKHVKAKQRMLVYRRVMLRLAGVVAENHKAHFLVTGDCLSQVASQTYHNLNATFAGAPYHVLTPLISMDKREITKITREIGTFDISSLQYEDCCSYYMPKHPELRATPAALDHQVSLLEIDALCEQALSETRSMVWK